MKHVLALLAFSVALAVQTTGSGYAAITVDNTVGGVPITASLLATVNGVTPSVCNGYLLTAAINYRYDGGAPTSTVGMPLAVGERLSISGITNLAQFRAIRTTGSNGELRMTCER